jgi:hypothetical protein
LDHEDYFSEALRELPLGQLTALAKSADAQASSLVKSGQYSWALVWRSLSVTARQAYVDQLTELGAR